MSSVQCLLGIRFNLLQLWKKYEILTESNGVRPEQLRGHLNPWLCYQEEQQSWSQARTFWKTKDVLPDETDAEKGTSVKARKPSNDTVTIVRQWIVQKLVVCHRVGRKTPNVVRQNCVGEAHLRRHISWKISKIEALDSHVKYRRTSTTTQSTTRICSSEKRMQTIARRAPGKDPRRKKNHS